MICRQKKFRLNKQYFLLDLALLGRFNTIEKFNEY